MALWTQTCTDSGSEKCSVFHMDVPQKPFCLRDASRGFNPQQIWAKWCDFPAFNRIIRAVCKIPGVDGDAGCSSKCLLPFLAQILWGVGAVVDEVLFPSQEGVKALYSLDLLPVIHRAPTMRKEVKSPSLLHPWADNRKMDLKSCSFFSLSWA